MQDKTFSQQIKEERVRTGLSQVKFGEKLGIPRRTIQDWERGVFEPDKFKLKAVLEAARELPSKEEG